jgi:hypothetical protein
MHPKIKAFDALAESRKWRERVSRKIAKMTPAEELAFFNRRRDAVRSQPPALPTVFERRS